MPDEHLLLLGLNALARAHELDYFVDGHRGAGMVAAHLLIQGSDIDEGAKLRIADLVDLNWAHLALCEPFPDTEPEPERIDEIGEVLLEGAETLRQVGHNAIFAMLAIKAFRMMPRAATPERIDGVCALVKSMTPWHDIEPDSDVNPPPFADAAAASHFILQEASAAIDLFTGFGQGFAGHMLTFGQALVGLAGMGDVALAEACRQAFRKYVTVTRRGPDPDSKPRPDHDPSDLRPRDAAYWYNRADNTVDIGHVFKYPYSYYDLLRRVDDTALRQKWDGKVHQLF